MTEAGRRFDEMKVELNGFLLADNVMVRDG